MNVIAVSRSRDLAYRVEPGVWCNSTLCNCLSMREVNHVMQTIEVINYDKLNDDDPLLIQARTQVDTWRDRSDALGDELDGVFE